MKTTAHSVIFISSLCLCATFAEPVWLPAQSSSSKSKNTKSAKANLKMMEIQAEKLQTEFVKQTINLALDYAKIGEYKKSKTLLNQIRKLNTPVPGLNQRINQKIDELDEALLAENGLEIEFPISNNWGKPVVAVTAGRPFRLQITGSYKFIASGLVGPEGFPTANGQNQSMASGIPCGAVMGLIIQKGKKPGKPFIIGKGKEVNPKEGGVLFLKVNTPPGSKCSGRLKLQLSGGIQKLSG